MDVTLLAQIGSGPAGDLLTSRTDNDADVVEFAFGPKQTLTVFVKSPRCWRCFAIGALSRLGGTVTRPGQVGDNTPTKQRRVLQASPELYGSQSGADSEASIARLTRERDEALAQQTATSEILLFFPWVLCRNHAGC